MLRVASAHAKGPDPSLSLAFGPFCLVRARKQLLEGQQPVRLGSRAMDLLIALVEQAGQVVSRDQLEARIWPRTVVEETSLRVHISALRKVLRDGHNGQRYITNIPGRGYCFVAPVSVLEPPAEPRRQRPERESEASSRLPTRLTHVVGRDDVTAALGVHLAQRRLVSIVGTGGIGKTTVALAVATARIQDYEHGAHFVDLAALSDPQLVPGALAFALGVPLALDAPLPALCAYLSERRILIVLDNCEHVIEAAASLVESAMKAAPQLHILTTSREPLYAEGEWVHRLASLRAPGAGERLTTEQALEFSAIQLFVERAAANTDGFVLTEEILPAVRQLCHQLDGIPLAIELAAARVDSLGVLGLAERLDNLFQLLTRGRRTALSRHRTLEALLDWSYDLLTPTEQRILLRLSVFRSGFTLASAASVAADDGMPPELVTEAVLSLTDKSLVNVDAGGDVVQHRLLYMTRAYAMRKLEQSGGSRPLHLRHARHFCELSTFASEQFGFLPLADRNDLYARLIDDIRAALDWAFSADGDDPAGIELTASVRIAIFSLGLIGEYTERVEVGLQRVATLSPPDPVLELKMCTAWCFLSGHLIGMNRRQVEMFRRSLDLAERLGNAELLIETLYGICVGALGQGRYDVLATMAQRVRELASGKDAALAVLLGERMLVHAHHCLGHHDAAHALIERVVDHPSQPRHQWYAGVSRAISMRIVEAKIFWLQGQCDRAVAVANKAMQGAIGQHPFALCQVLAMAAIPIALWCGNIGGAAAWVELLMEEATRNASSYWQSWAQSFRQVIVQLNQAADAPALAHARNWDMPSNWMELDMMATLSGDMLTEETLARAESGAVGWCAPEILRAQGENLLRRLGTQGRQLAESLFRRALEMARRQNALSWELRASHSLARLYAGMSRQREARELLAAPLEKFTQGFGTADVTRAGAFLQALDAQLEAECD